MADECEYSWDDVDSLFVTRSQRKWEWPHYMLILKREDVIGAVKTGYGGFNSFVLSEEHQDFARDAAQTVLSYMHRYRGEEIQADVGDKYWPVFEELGFEFRFKRVKMGAKTDQFSDDAISVRDEQNRIGMEVIPFPFDIPRIAAIFDDAYSNGVDTRMGLYSPQKIAMDLERTFSGEFGQVLGDASFVARSGDADVAAMICSQESNVLGFLVIVGTVQSHRGKGIGKALIRTSMAEMNGKGIDRCALWVTEGNPAIKLYESLGFSRIGSFVACDHLGNQPTEL